MENVLQHIRSRMRARARAAIAIAPAGHTLEICVGAGA